MGPSGFFLAAIQVQQQWGLADYDGMYVQCGDLVTPLCEPTNPYDADAIAAWRTEQDIGYVGREAVKALHKQHGEMTIQGLYGTCGFVRFLTSMVNWQCTVVIIYMQETLSRVRGMRDALARTGVYSLIPSRCWHGGAVTSINILDYWFMVLWHY